MDYQDYKSKLTEKQIKLLKAVKNGTYAEVQNVMNHSHSFKDDKVFDYILLVTALQRKHKSISKFLIKKGCPVKISLKTGVYCTPLYYAVDMDDLEVFKTLRKKRALVFAKDANKDTALELAMHKSNKTMVNVLLDEFISNLYHLGYSGKNATAFFHAACWINNSKAIQTFMFLNFSRKSRSKFGRDEWKGFTTLHFVLHNQYDRRDETIVKLLNHDDVDFYAKNKKGETLLHLFFRNDYGSLCKSDIAIKRIIPVIKRTKMNTTDQNGLQHFHIFCGLKFHDKDTKEHLDIIEHFIDSEVDVNSAVSLGDPKFPGFTALHFAVKESFSNVLKLLLENGADPTKIDKSKQTPLHLMCAVVEIEQKQRLESVKLFLQYGANPVAKNSQDRTPLHESFCAHSIVRTLNETEKFLMSKNQESINHTDKNGLSYLHIACTGDDLGIVEALVKNGASVNSRVKTDSRWYAGYSPLHFAVESHQVEIVRFLLDRGADIDSRVNNNEKSTPLHMACLHRLENFERPDENDDGEKTRVESQPSYANHICIVELLIEHGACVNAETSSNSTPLLENCLVPPMLENQDSNDRREKSSESFLDKLCTKQKIVMDILLRHGANIKARSQHEGSILHILARNYKIYPFNIKLAEIALKEGADVNARDAKNFTPLHVAVEEAMRASLDTSFIDLLLEYDADINAKSVLQTTPLCQALTWYNNSSENRKVIEDLLSYFDIDVNLQAANGQTALHLAVNQRRYFLIDKLLEYGADINLEDESGHPPMHSFFVDFQENPSILGKKEDYQILLTFLYQVKKMMKLKFFVSEKVRSCYEKLLTYLTGTKSIDSEIDEEIVKLKSEKLDQYTSLYDILFKDSNSMVKHSKNENFLAALTSFSFGWDYFIFGDIITRQYDRGLKRYAILEPAKTVLNSLTSVNWPDSCSDNILSYLSDETLKDLIESLPAGETRKRSSEGSYVLEEPSAKTIRLNNLEM